VAHEPSDLLGRHRVRGDHDLVDRKRGREALHDHADVIADLGLGDVCHQAIPEPVAGVETLGERCRRRAVADENHGGEVVSEPPEAQQEEAHDGSGGTEGDGQERYRQQDCAAGEGVADEGPRAPEERDDREADADYQRFARGFDPLLQVPAGVSRKVRVTPPRHQRHQSSGDAPERDVAGVDEQRRAVHEEVGNPDCDERSTCQCHAGRGEEGEPLGAVPLRQHPTSCEVAGQKHLWTSGRVALDHLAADEEFQYVFRPLRRHCLPRLSRCGSPA